MTGLGKLDVIGILEGFGWSRFVNQCPKLTLGNKSKLIAFGCSSIRYCQPQSINVVLVYQVHLFMHAVASISTMLFVKLGAFSVSSSENEVFDHIHLKCDFFLNVVYYLNWN